MNQIITLSSNDNENNLENEFQDSKYDKRNNSKSMHNSLRNQKYKLQFFISFSLSIVFIIFFFWNLYQNSIQEKISRELLRNYKITSLYSNSEQYDTNLKDFSLESPFVIGMIKIDKIDISYPILSETSDELLKISLCRFAGPMPNEVGNLCIAGHNYIDNLFFSRLYELEYGTPIEVYDLSGKKYEYTVIQKFEVEENNLSCTNQDTGKNKLLTLLTCDNLDNNKRLVVQAKQK